MAGIKRKVSALTREISYKICLLRSLLGNFRPAGSGTILPTVIQLQTYNRCNGSCVICPYPATTAARPEQYLPRDLFDKIISEITGWQQTGPRPGTLVLSLQNEPLLDNRLESFIQQARRQLPADWKIEIVTNGTLLDGERSAHLAACPPDHLSVSLNAFNASTYTRLMPRFRMDTVLQNINQLLTVRQLRTGFILRFIKHTANAGEYRRFKRYWNKRGVPVYSYPANNRAGSCLDYPVTRFRYPAIITRLLQGLSRLLIPACPLLFTQASITAAGDVLLCCNDYRNQAVMGNLQHNSLAEIFNAKPYQTIRKQALEGKYAGICKQCSVFREWIS